jgi:hypothetical protein
MNNRYEPKTEYKPKPIPKPTKKERYIKNINKLLSQKHYHIVEDLLSRTKYEHDELPWNYWQKEITGELSKIEEATKHLEDLKGLEKLLNS